MLAKYMQLVTTMESREDAQRLARDVVEARLAACVQILGPLRSVYRWKGAVEAGGEWMCLMKTTAARLEELQSHIKANHPYETPEITATPIVGGSSDYLAWIDEETDGRHTGESIPPLER